jgi:hypothetical protein
MVVEEFLNLEEWTYDIFLDMQSRISGLQVDCPKQEAVVDARIRWYRRGLANFIKYVPDMLETPPTHREHRVQGQIMDLYTIEYFLTRHYLQGSFVSLYKEVVTLCTRTMKAANKRGQKDFAKMMLDLRSQLERSILEGNR